MLKRLVEGALADKWLRRSRHECDSVELLWLTDDLRIVRPEPLDEARNAIWYFDELFHKAVPLVLDEALQAEAQG